jgi:hypothetical protein
MLVTHTGLKKYHLNKKANKKGYRYKGYVCGTCARTKITRKSFNRKTTIHHTKFLEKVTCDISVYLNCPSREGWKYMLVFTDEATKMIWSYGLFERTADAVLVCLKDLYEKQLEANEKIELFHTDGGAELITERVKAYLRLKGTRKFTNTPTDTPELNSISERKFRTLGEMALAMLSRSGMPKVWWGKAYMAAEYILRRMPTKTAQGFMTPLEAIPGGEAPSWQWLKVWGCKAYVLTPKADRRKDWEDKAQVGYFVGYSETTVGWEIYLPASDTFVTTVHALFDESPPDRGEDYFKDLDEASAVFTGPESESVADYQYLVGTHHIDPDDQLLYETKRVVARKGLIVAYRAQLTGARIQKEEKNSIHVKDVAQMTSMTVSQRKAISDKATAEAEYKLLSRPHAKSSRIEEVSASRKTPYDECTENELRTRKRVSRDDSEKNNPANNATRGRSQVNSGCTTQKTADESTDESDLAMGEKTQKNTISVDGKRIRTLRRPVNISNMGGEINQIEIPYARHCYMSTLMNDVYTSPSHQLTGTDEKSDSVTSNKEPIEPLTDKQAMASKEWQLWVKAKIEENQALSEKNTMIVVKKEKWMTVLRSKYVFKVKKKYGKITRFKARLVALGFDEEVNPDQIFAPVVKPNTVRLLMALAQTEKMKIHQIDIQNAFCCSEIEGDVYMDPPEGMELPEGMCFKLQKSLYGLKSAPKSWNKTIDKALKALHFKPTVSDPCLYSRWSGGKQYLILVYVDDILIAGERVQHIQEIKDSICNKFAMTDMGELDNFLNANITQTREKITVDQTHYCKQVLQTFDFLVKKKTCVTPLPAEAVKELAEGIEVTEEHDEDVKSYPYRQVVGSLLYLAMYTKPEISYAVGVLSRFNDKKTAASCKLATHLLRYLNGQPQCVIEFKGNKLDLHAFSDADWAGDILTRRSTTGYIVFAAGGPISWQSKLQKTVATSSMESEYMAMYAGMQELVWIRGVLKELQRPQRQPTPFLIDSKSAQDLAMNPVFHARSKHIDIKYHWIRLHTSIEDDSFKTATLHHCSTIDMCADIFTKALGSSLFFRHAREITGKRCRQSQHAITPGQQPGGVTKWKKKNNYYDYNWW